LDHCAALIETLIPEQAENFMAARDLYLQGAFPAAQLKNESLLAWAEAQRSFIGQILGHRFVGLCQARLASYEDAVAHLRHALALAADCGCRVQVLLCSMQLGSTLRRQGELLPAYELFRDSLEQATLPDYIHERARLYGYMGSLLEQLGQRGAAFDAYSRMEELCELLGNANRLANARGMVARAAEFRGDLDLAQRKYEDECRLAEESGNIARLISGKLHLASLLAKRGRTADAQANGRRADLLRRSGCANRSCGTERPGQRAMGMSGQNLETGRAALAGASCRHNRTTSADRKCAGLASLEASLSPGLRLSRCRSSG
jgi:tetratricopeptide (TPR) repeat protein